MRIFLDANVLVSVLNKEYPLFQYSSRILSLADDERFAVFTTPLCLAIAFYFAEKKNKRTAKQRLKVLCNHIGIAAVTAATVKQAANDTAVQDLEDGMEYYAAVENNCHCIITEDVGDFYFAAMEVLTCEAFFKKYLVRR